MQSFRAHMRKAHPKEWSRLEANIPRLAAPQYAVLAACASSSSRKHRRFMPTSVCPFCSSVWLRSSQVALAIMTLNQAVDAQIAEIWRMTSTPMDTEGGKGQNQESTKKPRRQPPATGFSRGCSTVRCGTETEMPFPHPPHPKLPEKGSPHSA